MASLNDFVMQEPRQLPVIVAVDRSGSMNKEGKIDALNLSLKNFINSLKTEDSDRVEIKVALYSFGGIDEVTCDHDLAKVEDIHCTDYTAGGRTPLGKTLSTIKELIEDRNQIPSRSYAPTVVLITDGASTDSTDEALKEFIEEGRSAKAYRIAMAIGEDADIAFLESFVSSPEYLVSGEAASDIKKFFQFVTMSISQRTHSVSPDSVKITIQDIPEDDDEIVF